MGSISMTKGVKRKAYYETGGILMDEKKISADMCEVPKMRITEIIRQEALKHKDWKLADLKQIDNKYNVCTILKTNRYGNIFVDVQLRAYDDVIMGTVITPNRATGEISPLSIKQAVDAAVQRYKDMKSFEEQWERLAA